MLYIVLLFVAYLLFQFVFKFVIPVYRTTKQVKKSFREMHQKMQGQPNGTTPQQQNAPGKKEPIGDYIDFEEVKD